jgi:hypothetical protein
MIWLDYVVLAVLLLLIGVARLRERSWLCNFTLAMLVLTAGFFEMSLGPIARGVVGKRQKEGRWSKEYVDGVIDMKNAASNFRPYRLISVVGLAFFAFRYAKMNRRCAESVGDVASDPSRK